jgi:transketolase
LTGPHGDAHHYSENVAALADALEASQGRHRSTELHLPEDNHRWPAPKLQGTGKAHGAALGDEEVAATKEVLGFDPDKPFVVADDVIKHTRKLIERGAKAQQEWQQAYESWAAANPERTALYERLINNELSPGWEEALPTWDADRKGIATRAASGKILTAIAPKLPELWGGSADLAESNLTTPEGEPSFLPSDRQSRMFRGGPYGRVLHFGIREHAMGAILNGIKVHGGLRPYGGTFLIFSDYMRPSVRLAALMRLPVIYVWTTTRSASARTGPLISRLNTSPTCGQFPGWTSYGLRTPMRPPLPGQRS